MNKYTQGDTFINSPVLTGVSMQPAALSKTEAEPPEQARVREIKISVIIPTMNEPAISKVINETRQSLKHFNVEVIVVDKSTDDTAKKARKAGARVITQEHIGYGNALHDGLPVHRPDSEIVVMLDGDNTYDPMRYRCFSTPS
jgi:cellulose synthase/poly-beta-1,6-N-acetylglucosamine synthase-like glycosyltransferase